MSLNAIGSAIIQESYRTETAYEKCRREALGIPPQDLKREVEDYDTSIKSSWFKGLARLLNGEPVRIRAYRSLLAERKRRAGLVKRA